MNQLGASTLICLWNRFELRKRALVAGKKDWEPDNRLKIYGIRVLSDFYDVWIMEPIVDSEGEWQGATIQWLRKGLMVDELDFQTLCIWINEIHRWGLTIHAKVVEEDIAVCATASGLTLGQER